MRLSILLRRVLPGLVLGLASALSGCAGDDMSDLQSFVGDVKARPRPRVTPIPEFHPYETFLYGAAELRDPFQPVVDIQTLPTAAAQSTTALQPDFNRPRETLEVYPLDTLRMVGLLAQENSLWGIVKAADGTVHRIQVGNHMGQNHGKVNQISEDRILLTEIVPDGLGGWQERQAALTLNE